MVCDLMLELSDLRTSKMYNNIGKVWFVIYNNNKTINNTNLDVAITS